VCKLAEVAGPDGFPGPVLDMMTPRGGGWAAVWQANVPTSLTSGQWVVDCWIYIDPANADNSGYNDTYLRWYTTDATKPRWRIYSTTSSNVPVIGVEAADSTGFVFTQFLSGTSLNWADRTWHYLRVVATTSGSNTAVTFYLDGTSVASGTVAGVGPGSINRMTLVGFSETGTNIYDVMALANLAIYSSHDATQMATIYSAGRGYPGETATARIARLCDEQDVNLTVVGTSDTAMGPQLADTFLNLIRECETADHGVLYDGLGPGLVYATRAARYNISASLTADMAADPPQVAYPFDPADDDQRNRNVFKVDRKNGLSVTVEQTDGRLGTDAIGDYESSATLNVSTDSVLADHASWLNHLGTVEGFRYPRLNLDLAATPTIVSAWLAAGVADRIDVTNVTSRAVQHPAGTVPLLLEGWSESLGPFDWTVGANCSPYEPFEVFELEGSDNRGRLDLSQTLAADIDTTTTSLSVASTLTEDFEDSQYVYNIHGDTTTPWARTTVRAHSGSYSLKSGPIGDSANSDVYFRVPSGATSLTFWYRVSSEATFDFLRYSTNGGSSFTDLGSGEVGWTQGTINVTGVSEVLFRYAKDTATTSGDDAAYLDDVTFNSPSLLTTTATFPADFPFDVDVDGEQMTVTTVGAVLNTNPYFETDLTGWTLTTGCTVAASTTVAHRGVQSMRLTPDGVTATCFVQNDEAAVVAGQQYAAQGWLYTPTNWSSAGVRVNWFDAAHGYLSTDINDAALVGATWTRFSITLTAPVGAAYARIHPMIGATPPSSQLLYADDIVLLATAAASPQAVSVIRSVNGVVMPHPVGTALKLWKPGGLAL
jgi:hypothetical protein